MFLSRARVYLIFLFLTSLEKEGVEVEKDKIVRFNELFWDPAIEWSL